MNLDERVKEGWRISAEGYSAIVMHEYKAGEDKVWADLILEQSPYSGSLAILDAGCGPGFFPLILSKRGHRVTGIDGSEETHMTTRKYDICLKRTSSDSWVPHGSLLELFAPATTTVEKDVGVGWYDEALYGNIRKALASFNIEERRKYYDSVFKYISDEALTIPVYHPTVNFAVNGKKIADFRIGVNNYAPVEWEELRVK